MKFLIKWMLVTSVLMGFCSVLIAIYLYYHTFRLPEHKIIIGVLSAQNNFEARKSIRDTWKKLVNGDSVSLYFLVGEKFCDIPISDRISAYSCEERYLFKALTQTEGISTSQRCSRKLKPLYAGFTFVVHSSLVIQRLNILQSIVAKLQHVKVHLIDSATQETIISVSFSASNTTHRAYNSTVLSKAVEPYVLPKDFEGQIVMEAQEMLPLIYNCTLDWNNLNNALSFIQLIPEKHKKPVAFTSNSCSPVSMVFDIHDPEEVALHIKNRVNRQETWDKQTLALQERLLNESREMKDILLLNVVDVYRSLSKKLLLFLHWVNTNRKFSFVVKTDDDTFLDVLRIERKLSSLEPASLQSLWWWGSYRDHWAVSSSGKWREDVYRSLTYPTFPCGSGYVLGYHVVEYLARNAGILQTGFQGEDVAVGIWLAGLDTIRHRSDELVWSCDGTCVASGCNRAQLSVGDMYRTWELYNKCGNLCNCTVSN